MTLVLKNPRFVLRDLAILVLKNSRFVFRDLATLVLKNYRLVLRDLATRVLNNSRAQLAGGLGWAGLGKQLSLGPRETGCAAGEGWAGRRLGWAGLGWTGLGLGLPTTAGWAWPPPFWPPRPRPPGPRSGLAQKLQGVPQSL